MSYVADSIHGSPNLVQTAETIEYTLTVNITSLELCKQVTSI